MVRVIEPSFEILRVAEDPLRLIERAGRTCYKSEEKIGWRCPACKRPVPAPAAPSGSASPSPSVAGDLEGPEALPCPHCGAMLAQPEPSAVGFTQMIVNRGHESVLEHAVMSVRFVVNRGFSHELVRHRLASYSQESTRYCDYVKEKHDQQIVVIRPWWHAAGNAPAGAYDAWRAQMDAAEAAYRELRDAGLPPQAARGVLPLDVKTEIVMTANLREWRHVFQLRLSPAAHPDMPRVLRPCLRAFQRAVPVVFADLGESGGEEET